MQNPTVMQMMMSRLPAHMQRPEVLKAMLANSEIRGRMSALAQQTVCKNRHPCMLDCCLQPPVAALIPLFALFGDAVAPGNLLGDTAKQGSHHTLVRASPYLPACLPTNLHVDLGRAALMRVSVCGVGMLFVCMHTLLVAVQGLASIIQGVDMSKIPQGISATLQAGIDPARLVERFRESPSLAKAMENPRVLAALMDLARYSQPLAGFARHCQTITTATGCNAVLGATLQLLQEVHSVIHTSSTDHFASDATHSANLCGTLEGVST